MHLAGAQVRKKNVAVRRYRQKPRVLEFLRVDVDAETGGSCGQESLGRFGG